MAASPASHLPRAAHHVGITVSDLNRSVTWYRNVLGLTPGLRTGGWGAELAEVVQVQDPDLRAVFMHVGNIIVELIGYKKPAGRREVAANNDIGSAHVCFEVDDIEAACTHLREHGVPLNSPPFRIPGGPLEGYHAVYFRDPDGIQLEYFQLKAERLSGQSLSVSPPQARE